MVLTETEDGGEQGVADLEGESDGSTLVVVFDPHRNPPVELILVTTYLAQTCL